jgi:hypothetical protein
MSRNVQNVVWNWREEEAAAADGGPLPVAAAERRPLRRRSLIQALVAGLAGAVLVGLFGHRIAAFVVWGIGAAILVLGLAAPQLYRGVERWGQSLGRAVGSLLTALLLAPLFYLVFFPAAVLLRLRRHDPLHRAPLPAGRTGWLPRRQPPTPESYARQFLREDRGARDLDPLLAEDEAQR